MSHLQPPKWLDRLLQWYCAEELIEEIQGDLHEAYAHRAEHHGQFRANWSYFLDVIKFFRPYSFEKYSRSKQYLPMIQNYLKIATRNLLKKKGFTALNLTGLSIGISAVLLVSIYLRHELTYDQKFPEADNIYRLVNDYRDQTYNCMFFPDFYDSNKEVQLRLINHLKSYEEVAAACHFITTHSPIGPNDKYYVSVGDKKLVMEDMLYTNTGLAFQEVFPQSYIVGSPASSYGQFGKVVLTETSARKIFGNDWREQEVLNETIAIQEENYLVGGVIEDVPGNVHFDFTMIIHTERIPSWGAYSYVKLAPGFSIDQFMYRVNAQVELFFPGYTADELQKGIKALSLGDIHFTNGNLYELKATANQSYLTTFGIVGIVILLIIWTNYTNMSIASYAGRQKELGVRKLMGARAKDIRSQVFIEAILLTILCFPVAWLFIYYGLPSFNQWMQIGIDQEVMFDPFLLLFLGAILIFTGLISGLYPAVAFGRKSLTDLFEGKLNLVKSYRLLNFRNALLMTQFFFLVGLMSVTLIIKKQMDYVQKRDVGFVREGVLFFGVNGKEKYQQLKNELLQMPEVKEVGTGMIPGMDMYNQLTYKMQGMDKTLADGTLIYTSADALKVLGIQSEAFELLAAGQDSVMIINQTAAEKLAVIKGISPEELVGQKLVTEPEYENEEFGFGIHYSIAAIIDDFDYFSLKYPSQSLIMEVRRESDYVYNALVSIDTEDLIGTISEIEAKYLSVEMELPFDLVFLDEHLDQLYARERNAGNLATILTGICIVLAIMGLIGIVGYVTQSRQKEMGIRKVFGASLLDILLVINKNYVLLMLIATALALPVSIFLSKQWLDNFAYRISPDFTFVLLAGSITLLLVVTIVVIQSMRTARLNPTDTLRCE